MVFDEFAHCDADADAGAGAGADAVWCGVEDVARTIERMEDAKVTEVGEESDER